MQDNITFEDAIAIAWTNAPDAMQTIIDEMRACREEKFGVVREAKRKGLGTDWVLGEMLAYDEMIVNLEKSDTITEHSKPIQA